MRRTGNSEKFTVHEMEKSHPEIKNQILTAADTSMEEILKNDKVQWMLIHSPRMINRMITDGLEEMTVLHKSSVMLNEGKEICYSGAVSNAIQKINDDLNTEHGTAGIGDPELTLYAYCLLECCISFMRAAMDADGEEMLAE